ncbi:S1 family peptidase [Actinoalloteichus sp. AHMU CJ021]|uniref:Trypsin n=1 Tax=Actinoalloteichus caeruleus DSM 43889 TaxID=1120930 RepID=A0ABT1JLP0_ACTCY|nr:S1 family peptidase [Actinoalloteichus caeruleus]AUS79193.1 S1 family peptidase [Actinoalloteichus sp. AHMU CJ021]MCP2333445.1 Trypsin [Actinoalloteichus caeruleus DSM 43889]
MRPVRLTGLVATAAVVTATLTGVGAASAGERPADGPDRQDYSPGLLTSMADEFGITPLEAETRLGQEFAAMDAVDPAEEAAGSAYAGAWFDAERGALVVGVTDAGAADAVRAAAEVDVEVVEHSAAVLDGVVAELNAVAEEEAPPADVTSWYVDPAANEVVVTVLAGADDSTTAAFLAEARALGPVTVTEVSERPETFAAGTVGGDPYYINSNTRCSIGFSVHGGFVTAGHCGGAGSTVHGWDWSLMGNVAAASFPGNDHGWVRIGHGWWTEPVVLGWGTVHDVLVRGSSVAPVGSSICRSGSTTGWRCGTVEALNVTVNYQQGPVYGTTQTSACAQGGDSGGSFITGDQAQGVTSGGSGNCATGGRTFFAPVNPILSAYGLSLVLA